MDVLTYAEHIAKIVSQGKKRKYYRFRGAPFYGGIATADCVGCCLNCIFCWSWNIVANPEKHGKFYQPEFVVKELVKIARRKKYRHMRISGNEPTLNREHLLNVLNEIPLKYEFILETNGILPGHSKSYCHDLAQFPNLHVRVSLKGCNAADFEQLTGMEGNGFELQIKALENLLDEGVSCHPAVMHRFSKVTSLEKLLIRLEKIDPSFRTPELEQLLLYPPVEERLRTFRFIG